MVLEINPAGLENQLVKLYPSKQLLELAYEMNIDITFGSDVHSVEQVGLNMENCIMFWAKRKAIKMYNF